MKKSLVLKIAAGLTAAASVPFLWVYGAYRWAIWRTEHPTPHEVSSLAIIGGADGPTAIFITARMQMELYLLLGAALLAGAAGLWLLAQKSGKKRG